ncbi:type II CAAX prenyl endopeptidase Rce1 family protein [Butyrivibrio fibrisolvens]
MQLVLHYVFTWLYRRYGNIFGATILHGCVDMTMGLFG